MHEPAYRNKVAIITGASLGIGRSLSLQLAEQGACLVLAARSQEHLQKLAEECESSGGRALAVPTDVAEPVQCQALIEKTVEHFGHIDTLVNNAGISMIARFDEVRDPGLYERIMRVNYLGSVYCTHHCLPHLKRSQGQIVAIASLAGRTGVPLYSAYSASKHALIGFFESVRIELQSYGIAVTLVLPDFVSTGIHSRSVDGAGAIIGDAHNVDYERAMSTDECARRCLAAMTARKREVLLSWRGRLGQWVKLAAPGVIDAVTRRAIETGH
jgi:short-subunit dehydrogenase